MIDDIFLQVPRAARTVVVGVCLQMDHARPLIAGSEASRTNAAVNKELNVQYVLGYSAAEFRDTLRHIADGTVNVEPAITHTVGLDGVAQAFSPAP